MLHFKTKKSVDERPYIASFMFKFALRPHRQELQEERIE